MPDGTDMTLAIIDLMLSGDHDAAEALAQADPAELETATGEKSTFAEDQADTQTFVTSAHVGSGEPASGEVALAGRDGHALARLIRQSQSAGVKTFNAIVRDAVKRYTGKGPLLAPAELHTLSGTLAAVNATADLLGRSRVREMVERIDSHQELHTFADVPLARADGSVLATPEDAVSYFMSLYPSLGIDTHRYPGEQRRRAFTLAASCNQTLTARVQQIVADALRENRTLADAQNSITVALDASGATTRNPDYASMVFRTNAMDAFQTGAYEEGRSPDIRDYFPAWQYLGIDDERAGDDHRPKFDHYYPGHAAFADVRGPRPFNCRCSLRWVDRNEWRTLQGRGVEFSSY